MIFWEFLIWLFKTLLLMVFCLVMAFLAIFIVSIFYGQGVEQALQIFTEWWISIQTVA